MLCNRYTHNQCYFRVTVRFTHRFDITFANGPSLIYNIKYFTTVLTVPSFIHCSRCPPIFDLLLRYLAAYMAAASTFLHDQVRLQNCTAMARVGVTGSSNATTKQEREELCVALNATQSSTMVQLLLEICLTTDQDKEVGVVGVVTEVSRIYENIRLLPSPKK